MHKYSCFPTRKGCIVILLVGLVIYDTFIEKLTKLELKSCFGVLKWWNNFLKNFGLPFGPSNFWLKNGPSNVSTYPLKWRLEKISKTGLGNRPVKSTVWPKNEKNRVKTCRSEITGHFPHSSLPVSQMLEFRGQVPMLFFFSSSLRSF